MTKYPSSLDLIKQPDPATNSQDKVASGSWIFRCPICGGGAYEAVCANVIFGCPTNILHHKCSKCSVLFADPIKFTDVN